MYRHPNETVHWYKIFDNQFEKILACRKEIYLTGNLNRYLLQVNTKKTWLEYMESFGLEQIAMSPTRITDHSETLDDHIYCNSLSNVLSTKVSIIGINDHFPVFITRKLNSSSVLKKYHHSISYRSFKNFNETEFINDLSSTPYSGVDM